MPPSNDTIWEIAKALRRHVDAATLEKIVNEPLDVPKDAPRIGLSIEDQRREISERHERSRRLLEEVFAEVSAKEGASKC